MNDAFNLIGLVSYPHAKYAGTSKKEKLAVPT